MIRLGGFQLELPIGRGGMGEVWAATAPGHPRPLAIKLLTHRANADSVFLEAFRNEVRAAASLDHPNVVAVYDSGEADARAELSSNGAIPAGTPYLVMERVAGSTLLPLCGRLSWSDVQVILEQLLAALGHAHSRGVIHRDLKPANVLVERHDDTLRVKLTDFGLAHAFEGGSDLTLGGGTPSYMAPEQFTGTWRDFGPWTDLYGLACLAWTIVRGQPPFGITKSLEEKRRQHLRDAPPPLGPTTPVPPGFEGWLQRLLEKDPNARFRKAADAAAALRLVAQSPPPDALAIDLGEVGDADTLDLGAPELGESTLVLGETTDPVGLRPPQAPEPAEGAFTEDWRSADAPLWEVGGMGLYGLRTIPIVGREAERDALWGELRHVAAGGHAAAVLLTGPAGSGKSRLAQWLCERADELGAAASLRCTHGSVPGPGHGIATMLANYLRCQNLPRSEVAARVEAMYRSGDAPHPDEWQAITELIAPRGAKARGGVRFQTAIERYIPIRRLLGTAARERPVIVWLDDVQWGRDALGLAAYLLDVQTRHPASLLLVLTATDEELSQRPEEQALVSALTRRSGVRRIEVGALAPAHHTRLVHNLLGLDADLARRVEERTAGNPLFAVQLVGDWVTRGLLEPSPSGYRLRAGVTVQLPADVQAVWGERVERLLADRPLGQVAALELAACLGSDVDADEWQAVCVRAGADASPAAVDALLDQRLATAGLGGPRRSWSFAHAMLRETLVELARRSGRLALHHRACAEEIAARPGPGRAQRLAHHRVASGQTADSLQPFLQAADERIGTGDHDAAESLLAERDSWMAHLGLSPSDPRWGDGWLLRQDLARRRGEPEVAAEWLERVETAARRFGWKAARARVLVLQAGVNRTKGDPKEAERLAVEGEARAREANDLTWVAEARYELAAIAKAVGDYAAAVSWVERAQQAFEAIGDRVGVARTLMLHGQAEMQVGRWPESTLLLRASEGAFEAAGNRTGMANALNSLGDLHRFTGDLAAAEQSYRRSRGLFRAAGAWQWVYPELNLLQLLLGRREFSAAEGALETLGREFERMGARTTLMPIHLGLALCAADTGRWLAWDDQLREAWNLVNETGWSDEDSARLAQAAGERSFEAGERARALDAYLLSRALWRSLGRDHEAALIASLIAQLEPE